ncbi:V-type ATP synthase subunit F [Candidatus Bathyarchaeota archaeon]|nr:V-type ATP synthase subunit F [Candidatus Bathyarchaeota archaeon]
MLFKLGGIRHTYAVRSQEEVEKVIKEIVEGGDFSVLILMERFAEVVQPLLTRMMKTQKYPIAITIPDRKGPIEKEVDPVFEIIKEALGVELKIKKKG